MRFLTDESCDFALVRALRAAGHDVVAMAEVAPRAEDDAVAELAARDDRILLTEDKDFRRVVYAKGRPSAGVILIRFPTDARNTLPATVLSSIARYGERVSGPFVVVSPGRVRIAGPRQAPSG